MGIVLSANTFLMALLQVPVGGRVTDTGNKVVLIVVGSAITALAIAAIPISGGSFWPPLLAITSFVGIGGAIQQPAIMALTVDAGRTIGMGTSMGAYNTVFGIGMIIAPLMGGRLHGLHRHRRRLLRRRCDKPPRNRDIRGDDAEERPSSRYERYSRVRVDLLRSPVPSAKRPT
ncbi:MFS transporter [Methanoculleus chikugoensis]|uniref:MFS transporter n=1 Tax=Methanoculleus chikugoensis TaxID=118126 RepID=UPI000A60FC81|nr:MFS transporter [Methanoculleus chikugoensis]